MRVFDMGENLPQGLPSELQPSWGEYREQLQRAFEYGGRGNADNPNAQAAQAQANMTLARIRRRAEELTNLGVNTAGMERMAADINGDISRMFGGIDYSAGQAVPAVMVGRIGGENYVYSSSGANDPALDMLNGGMRRVMEDRARNLLGIKDEPKPAPKKPPTPTVNLRPQRLVQVDDETVL